MCKNISAEVLEKRALNFSGTFFTVAIKEGVSEFLHVDWNDRVGGVTFVIPFGEWEGGYLCTPQLGVRVPIGAGQMVAALTRHLMHCSTPVTSGKRYVMTLFTDRGLYAAMREANGV